MPTIDPELHALIPPLTTEEYQQLEANILADGIREPITLWNGVIVDGHNRFTIAQKNWIDCPAQEKSFADRDAVIDWMICNQLGRRNLSPNQQSYLRGLQYEREKKKTGAPEGNKNAEKQIGQNEPIVSTAERLAEVHNVSPATIKRDAEYSKAVDTITANTSPEIKQKILTRDMSVTKTDLLHLARMEPSEQQTAVEKVSTGEVKTISQYIKEQSKQDPDCKKIDREHKIQDTIGDCIDLVAIRKIKDYDEAVSLYFEWNNVFTVEDCLYRLNQSIEHLNNIKTALKNYNKLKVVK